jgi:hypothetical protein
MDTLLKIPPGMRRQDRVVYSLRPRRVLDGAKTYKKQSVFARDLLFLTDVESKILESACLAVANAAGIRPTDQPIESESRAKSCCPRFS